MTNEHSRRDRAVSNLTRRHAIASGGVLLAAGGTLVVAAEPANAAVQVDELSIPDESFTRESMTPELSVTAGYQYDAGSEPVERLEFGLSVDGTEIASEDLVTDRTTLENSTTLSALVTDSEAWTVEDFQPAVAETVERELTVELSFAVIDVDGSKIVADSATEDVMVSVNHPQDSKLTATVGGTGQVSAADE